MVSPELAHNWLYTLRERLTADQKGRFESYQAFSGFIHITELITLDSMMCPDLVTELRSEDWQHNIHQDFRTGLFHNLDYLLTRQPLDPAKHQVLAVMECPSVIHKVPPGFTACGYDIMDAYFGNSTLTNCGSIPDAFHPSNVNSFGLIDDCDTAFAIRNTMHQLQPDDPHLGRCEVWLLARKLLN
ncbi:MAG: hypothetical protein AAF821_05995 [Cyanobacteria bacterium P01_D01_bin.156]